MAGEITPPTYPTATALGNINLASGVYTAAQVQSVAEATANAAVDAVESYIGSALSTVWKAGGSKDGSGLTPSLLVAANEGMVYNLTDDVTTTSDWVEGAGKTISAGTDVAVISVGTAASPSYKFNALAPKDASVVKSVQGVAPNSSGDVPVYGQGGISVYESNGSLVVDGSSLSGDVADLSGTVGNIYGEVFDSSGNSVISGISGSVESLAGDVSGIKNFSKVTVKDSSGNIVTNGTITPMSNADDRLAFKAGSNVTLSTSGTHVVISASQPTVSYPVTDGKINGGSSLLSGTTLVIPVASTTAQGVTQLSNSVSNSTTTAITPNAVSGAVSGVLNTVSGTLNSYVSGGTLHANLVNKGLSNPSSGLNNTIYGLIAALHASDESSEMS